MARPQFKPTTAQRRMVSIAAAAGFAHSDIAEDLAISRPTLLKHFADELAKGATRRRLAVVQAVYGQAIKGNMAAARMFLTMNEGATKNQEPPEAEPGPPPAKVEKLGKKEQAAADAVGAQTGTDWNDLLPRGRAPLLQ